MQKGLIALGILVYAALLVSACTAGTGLRISYKELTKDEELLIETSGGVIGDHFTLEGKLPKHHYLEVTVEQFNKGERVKGEQFVTRIDKEYGNSAPLSFAIHTAKEYGHDQMVVGIPGGSVTVDLESIVDNTTSHGPVSVDAVTVELNKPIYISTWVSSSSMRLATPSFLGSTFPDMSSYDDAFLFKVELKEK